MQKLLLLFCFLLSVSAAVAQNTEDQARDDLDYYKKGDDKESRRGGGDLWYGGGFQLGFNADQFSSAFVVGVSPMVGYKVNNFLSVGPRGAIAYNALRFENGTADRDKVNFVTWEAGLFARAKIYAPFFAHVEYSLVNEATTRDGTGGVNKITRGIPFAGVGINQGGGPGVMGGEILVLIRLSRSEFLFDSPIVYRFGFNYNF